MMKDDDVTQAKGAAMQRFINNPDDLVDETVAGFVKAHGALVRKDPLNARVVVSRFAPQEGKVGIVTGGGSGHEPAFIGYTGASPYAELADFFEEARRDAAEMQPRCSRDAAELVSL